MIRNTDRRHHLKYSRSKANPNNFGGLEVARNTKQVWSPEHIQEVQKPQPIHPAIRAFRKNTKAMLQDQKSKIEAAMQLKHELLLQQIDAEIEDTKNKLQQFHQMNDAINEKSTKRLKRISEAITGEME